MAKQNLIGITPDQLLQPGTALQVFLKTVIDIITGIQNHEITFNSITMK